MPVRPDPAEHYDMVRRIAKGYARAVRGRLEPEDVEQMGMVALVTACADFDPGRGVPFSGYAVPAVQRGIVDQIRAELGQCRPRCWLGSEIDGMPVVECDGGMADAETRVLAAEGLRLVDRRSRLVLEMRYGIGWDHTYTMRQIARSLGWPVSAAQRIHAVALRSIRRSMEMNEA